MSISQILKHARESRRFDLPAVASFTQISEARLKQFEAGTREPSYRQLEKLGAAYGLPAYSFASRALPNLPESIPDFRKADPRPAELSPAGMQRIFSAEEIARFTNQIAIELDYTKNDFLDAGIGSGLSIADAQALRDSFDEWFAKKKSSLSLAGADDQILLAALRLFIEAQGVVININDAPSKDFLGFYVENEYITPTIFVNRSILSKKAQVFTLAHELAHHLSGKSGVSSPFQIRNSIERKCNKFAAEFLAPINQFRRIVEGFSKSIRSDTNSLIAAASKSTFLSRHAAAIRLIEAGFIDRPRYALWRSQQRTILQDEKADEGAEVKEITYAQPHAKRIGELGYLSTYLAKKAVDKKIIDSLDVQVSLGLSIGLQQKAFSLAERRFEVARLK